MKACLPESLIFDLVARATGAQPVRREQMTRGADNEVYGVETAEGPAFVVRVRRHGEVPFSQEAWALEQARRAGASVTEVRWLGTISADGAEHEAMVQTRLPGRSLREVLPFLSPATVDAVLEQTGALLRRVHSVPVDGYYRRLDNGSWDFQRYERLLEVTLRERAAERPLLRQAGFGHGDIDRMLEMIRDDGTRFPCRRPVLLHGDFRPEHVLVDAENRVSGLIDFGEFQGGCPLVDLALWSMDVPDLPLAPLLRGYADPALSDANFDRRLAAAKVALGMGYLAHHVRSGNVAEAAPFAKELRRATG